MSEADEIRKELHLTRDELVSGANAQAEEIWRHPFNQSLNTFVQTDPSIPAREAVSNRAGFMHAAGASVYILEMPAAEVEPLQTRHLFLSLISNALKYQGGQTPVVKTYGAHCSYGEWQIFVEKDEGGRRKDEG